MAPNTDVVDRLNQRAQRLRRRARELDPDGHRHQDEIASARRLLVDLPYRLDKAQAELAAADDTLDRLNTSVVENRDVLARRGDIEAEIAYLDDQLAFDLRIRSRVTRREQPEAGSSPSSAPDQATATTAALGTSPPAASPNTKQPSSSRPVSGREATTSTSPPTARATRTWPA